MFLSDYTRPEEGMVSERDQEVEEEEGGGSAGAPMNNLPLVVGWDMGKILLSIKVQPRRGGDVLLPPPCLAFDR